MMMMVMMITEKSKAVPVYAMKTCYGGAAGKSSTHSQPRH